MAEPCFLGMSSCPFVPTFCPLHLLPPPKAPNHPTPPPPAACCLPGWACSCPGSSHDWHSACCRAMSWAHLPHPTCICPPFFFPVLGMACNPLLPEPQPLHTKNVPLICLLVELKGQISKKIPAVGLGRQPQGRDMAAPEGTGGGSAQPFPPKAHPVGVWLPQKPGLGLLQTQQARAQATIRRKKY